ncbi:DNA helicase [Lysinibacillus alkalisoli]|uniref:DNA helicase n=1 Tax=Lysinibacillus alkalisoli TaxID=1911548 RepID=A0A917G2B9_9BACI|nr:nuclease-related domain-containing DEAD/DEAH box helicase [Lysinibacillus alkalisoli]GGG18374.1 DNA helicase [Lysinibacillus alkalisoli]
MAICIPETIPAKAMPGERLLFTTLKKYLNDDYIVYYEPQIKGSRPDFVIIGPMLGIVVLEVKDYLEQTIMYLNANDCQLLTKEGKQITQKNPLLQAREYAFTIINMLKRDSDLTQREGAYKGGLLFPVGYGCVFTRMHQKYFVEQGFYNIIEPQFCLMRDEIDAKHDNFEQDILIEKLNNMFNMGFRLREPLTTEQINRIRFHLFPEVRISADMATPYNENTLLNLRNIKTMDLHQENLAKQLGDKHRLIRGVAGSGKTLILASRAKLLSKAHPEWRILVLCYNIALKQFLEQMIERMMNEPDEYGKEVNKKAHNITVKTFNSLLYWDFKTQDVAAILNEIRAGKRDVPQYDAILIDEGQDFEDSWYQLITYLLNPNTASLLLVEDGAQNIYERPRSYIEATGLDFRGRSKVLTINYRNSAPIVSYAWDFYSHFLLQQPNETTAKDILVPQKTLRQGREPVIVQSKNDKEEMQQVIAMIRNLHDNYKVPYAEIAVLHYTHRSATSFCAALKRTKIPHYDVTESSTAKRNYQRSADEVTVSTIHSSKGLDFQAVIIRGVEYLSIYKIEDSKASLLYIAMTRARDYLYLSHCKESAYTNYFKKLNEV